LSRLVTDRYLSATPWIRTEHDRASNLSSGRIEPAGGRPAGAGASPQHFLRPIGRAWRRQVQ